MESFSVNAYSEECHSREIKQNSSKRKVTDILPLIFYVFFIVATTVFIITNSESHNETSNSKDNLLTYILSEVSDRQYIVLWRQPSNILIAFSFLFVISCIIFLLFLLLIKKSGKYFIWTINLLFILCLLVSSIVIIKDHLIYGIGLILMLILQIVALFWFRSKITLVGRLLQETSIVVLKNSLLAVLPFVTIAIVSVVIAFLSIFLQKLHYSDPNNITFGFRLTFAVLAFLWSLSFVIECQDFIIYGTITKWYFKRDKSSLGHTILWNIRNLVMYHVGSICLSSVLISVGKFLKNPVGGIKKLIDSSSNFETLPLGNFIKSLINFLNEISSNAIRCAYILISRDGKSFLEAGKEINKILSRNHINIAGITRVYYFTMVITKAVIMFGCFLVLMTINRIAEFGNDSSALIGIVLIYMLCSVHCFVSVFELAIDAILVCICIDCHENDGAERAYYMDSNIEDFMKELKEHDEKRAAEVSNNN